MPHRRDCEGSRYLVPTAPPLIPKREAWRHSPERCTGLHFTPPLTMLICYEAIYFYGRLSSTNTIVERCDRCGIRHQIFPVLVTIQFLVTLCSFKIENILSVLVL